MCVKPLHTIDVISKNMLLCIVMKRILTILLCIVALSSCSITRYYADFTTADAENEMALLGPVSTIYYLDSNRHEYYSDTLSVISENLITEEALWMGVPVNTVMPLDSLHREEAMAFMDYLTVVDDKNVGSIPIPGVLDDMLEDSGYRYGLLLFATGMSRDKAGYVTQAVLGAALGVATAVLTRGAVVMYGTPLAYQSMIHAAVLDSLTNRVVYYSYDDPKEMDPVERRSVARQLKRLLKGFLK